MRRPTEETVQSDFLIIQMFYDQMICIHGKGSVLVVQLESYLKFCTGNAVTKDSSKGSF